VYGKLLESGGARRKPARRSFEGTQ
jgi:hypothetical protein